ncbi:unnamed protein product [Lactuca saligna]|uniref:DUF7074 domain-containing protein n=1 Tax=Lactuca saligna TaxID=75948 RepID=A0AA35ZN05_LACSI|nr:unnamed protein product [Lactuca saligna]
MLTQVFHLGHPTLEQIGTLIPFSTSRAPDFTIPLHLICDYGDCDWVNCQCYCPMERTGPNSGSESVAVFSGVNCSDREVLMAIKKFNLKHFESIMFLDYQTPVNTSTPNECDVTWRFQNQKEKSWRRYRDLKRFKIEFTDSYTYKVSEQKDVIPVLMHIVPDKPHWEKDIGGVEPSANKLIEPISIELTAANHDFGEKIVDLVEAYTGRSSSTLAEAGSSKKLRGSGVASRKKVSRKQGLCFQVPINLLKCIWTV